MADPIPFERLTPGYVSASTARCFEAAASRLSAAQALAKDGSADDTPAMIGHFGAILIECARGITYAISELTDAVQNRALR